MATKFIVQSSNERGGYSHQLFANLLDGYCIRKLILISLKFTLEVCMFHICYFTVTCKLLRRGWNTWWTSTLHIICLVEPENKPGSKLAPKEWAEVREFCHSFENKKCPQHHHLWPGKRWIVLWMVNCACSSSALWILPSGPRVWNTQIFNFGNFSSF